MSDPVDQHFGLAGMNQLGEFDSIAYPYTVIFPFRLTKHYQDGTSCCAAEWPSAGIEHTAEAIPFRPET